MIHSGRLETSIVEGYLTRMINEANQRLTDNTQSRSQISICYKEVGSDKTFNLVIFFNAK